MDQEFAIIFFFAMATAGILALSYSPECRTRWHVFCLWMLFSCIHTVIYFGLLMAIMAVIVTKG